MKFIYIKANDYDCWLRLTPNNLKNYNLKTLPGGKEVAIDFGDNEESRKMAKKIAKGYHKLNFTFRFYD